MRAEGPSASAVGQAALPDWLDPGPWLGRAREAREARVRAALACEAPGVAEFAALISPAAAAWLDPMAGRARALTRRHFGKAVSLYVPLYLSNYCPGGCAYCGFASDRRQSRRRLELDAVRSEVLALKQRGFEDVLLLTGERSPEAEWEYLRDCVGVAAQHVHNPTVESFAMSCEEYAGLSAVGCTGVTIYQETYDPEVYAQVHRWGPKRDYADRLEAPARALASGLRTAGVGVLLGLADPLFDALALFQHVVHLRTHCWRGGVLVSFPRLCHEVGGFEPRYPVGDRMLAQLIFAFRICLPDVPLVLSTRERPAFRDGIAGIGISRMSAASRTTVGGYGEDGPATGGQFDVTDTRDAEAVCGALRARGLEPVFKNWDSVFA